MRKLLPALFACILCTAILAGCSSQSTVVESTPQAATTPQSPTPAPTAKNQEGETTIAPSTADLAPAVTIRVGSLKGPTSMGLVSLMDKAEKGEASSDYQFTMVTAADELLAKVVNNELDIALVPANVASVLYNKTQGKVSVIDINTLGVLYVVSGDSTVGSMADLKGKTVYLTGKGTTPDYVLQYLLSANDLTFGSSGQDVSLEYKSEPSEVAALLKEKPDAIGLLPQPFVTVAMAQNESLQIVLDLTKEWNTVQNDGGSQLVTGVTIVRNEFLEQNQKAVNTFLADHKASAEFVNSNLDEASQLVAAAGIIEKAPVAKKAMPYCNITYIAGEDMKAALSGYLEVLFTLDPASVGGKLPEDNFYYLP